MVEFIVVMGAVAAVATLWQRLRRLEGEVARLNDRLISIDPGRLAEPWPADPPAVRQPVAVVIRPRTPPADPPAASPPIADLAPIPESAPPPGERHGFEQLVGGRLPIWIGGAALVLAGFFLVRYSIESGLLGPGMRVLLAAIFSATLLTASEVARRWPLTRDDPRVGQALAGAGTASAYGTLYVAAAQYQLIGPIAAFALMIAITGGALALALRHGPPTAIMALVGGFAAPLVTGFDGAGVGPLLVYLAVFVAALFGLAIRRGWAWLAIAAVVAGFGWANLIVVLLDGRDVAAVGAFVVALAIGGTLALPRAAGSLPGRWALAPLVAGLVQLLVLAPVLDYSAVAWSFYLILAGATLVLAWRDARLEPGAVAAAVLVLVLLAGALGGVAQPATSWAVIIATLLFAGAGLALSRRHANWAIVALLGLAGPVLIAHGLAPRLLAPAAWTMTELGLAALAGLLAWRHRDRAGNEHPDAGLVGGSAVAALLATVAVAAPLPMIWASLPASVALVALAAWAWRCPAPGLARLPALALAALVALALPALLDMLDVATSAIGGARLTYPLLPNGREIVLRLAVPAAAALGVLALNRDGFGRSRRPAAIVIAGFAVLAAYGLAKQPLAIASEPAFVAYGFAERAAITLGLLGAGVLAWRRASLTRLGDALATIALARIVWLDLGVVSPLAVPQQVGTLPVANLAVLLPAAAAAMLIGRSGGWRIASLTLTALACAAAVRQLAHGGVLTGPVTSAENWGYSAVFLLLASVWLWRGIATTSRTLRIAGLGLLTLVTLKVFLIDVAAFGGILRILSLLGLGVALIAIGWAYGRVFARAPAEPPPSP